MKRKFILLLGMFLGGCLVTAAQTPAPGMVPGQDRTAPMMAMVRPVPAPSLAASLPLPKHAGNSAPRNVPAPLLPVSLPAPKNPPDSAAHFSYVIARPYEPDPGLEGLESMSQMTEVNTIFLSQSTLPLVQTLGRTLAV